MRKSNWGRLMTIKWGMDFYNSVAYVHTHNRFWAAVCHIYLRLRGFKPV